MKAIIIEVCENCPLAHISRHRLYCDSAAVVMKRLFKDRFVGKLFDKSNTIPEWCPLSNMSDEVISWLHDNGMPFKDLPLLITNLALKEEGRLPIPNKKIQIRSR